jgi:aminoglycoside phosphotransferase family enzyme/predicted kinase
VPDEHSIDVVTLIDALSRPEAYPHPVESVEVHQTHISVVFLAGPFAYKVKKPVNLGFLDFSTLEKRKHFCEEEVRLNRRLAPHVYLGVIPITGPNLRFGGNGPAFDWAVQMKRLPAEATLESRVMRDEVTTAQLEAVARRLADFHRDAEHAAGIAEFGRFDVVSVNTRENFIQSESHIGTTVSPAVYERVRALAEAKLAEQRGRIERRAERARDTHGDLHLDHVYLFPKEAPPNDLVIIDCIEFANRFRYADPIADMAFLAMDLAFRGRRDLAAEFAEAYFGASGDADGRPLLPMYAAYRAAVRAKVEGMKLGEAEIKPEKRDKAKRRARAYWLVALSELEESTKQPALVLLAGLPGSGKSTLARFAADNANFRVLRSDVLRKELTATIPLAPTGKIALNEGIYAKPWTDRTYAELLNQTERLLWHGERILIDANFREDAQRLPFFDAALRWGVPILFVQCTATPEVTWARLQNRRGDASDANWDIYQQLARTWEPVSQSWQRVVHSIDTSGPIAASQHRLVEILQQAGLLDSAHV